MTQDWVENITDIHKKSTRERTSIIFDAFDSVKDKGDESPDFQAAVALMESLADDDGVYWYNYLVSDFAIAGLDLLGVKKYDGDREEIRGLIETDLAS